MERQQALERQQQLQGLVVQRLVVELRCFGALRWEQGIIDGKTVLLDVIRIDYEY